ncbi:chemotaxis protein CheA [Azoarcus sp. KH32C]|uniref:chemotaxis protein CheA n=1 Tax=Azoarcus sp. KH32C TaxID=748247 RepID=UPI00023869C3|nr:chemotaxis protein CheA [Azoarcus sp. KH32C]BAL26475.1 two-component system, chemotaxis family, sensor kinase [Azoarcus sp. KH32C]
MNIDAALPTFIAESNELLASMDDCLLLLEREPDNAEAIAATFRAIHTIKGSAGLFGLDCIVRFAHVAESVLDRAREGELPIDDALTALLLECRDHIGDLVATVSGDDSAAADAVAPRGEALLERLRRLLSYDVVPAADGPCRASTCRATDCGLGPCPRHDESPAHGGVASDTWHVSLRFGPDVLANGMDPAAFLRYLATLGEVERTVTLWDGMPAADTMDPERCYLGFEIALRSTAERQAIEGAFDFVRDDCRIAILPPHSPLEDYRQLIATLPEGRERAAELLLACGTLDAVELACAMADEPAPPEPPAAAPPVAEPLVAEPAAAPPATRAPTGESRRSQERRGQEAKFVRVDAAKLEALINQVGEMVIASASAALHARRSGDGLLNEAMSLMGRQIEELRDSALSLRMVEIGETFSRFHRVVRDVSRELGKDIKLVTTGDDTELDKMVVEKINDPLMHLVRNAMDHGIEPVDLRTARGKPATATVRLNAYHESGSIIIEVSDDGGGLPRDKLLQKGIERGLVAPGQALSDHEVFKLIFEPGFSTAEQVTNLSGRGVGMDVVRRNIEALRGSIEIDSTPAVGTTMRIRLPLTLAIIDGFLIEVAGSPFVVPLDMVVECLELPDSERSTGNGRHYLNLRGEVLPFVRLRELFGIEGDAARRENVVVVTFAGQKAGLVVDRLFGELQTVIKPLGAVFRHLRGISGSTILGSGEVALILDVPATVQQAASREAGERPDTAAQTRRPLPASASPLAIH